MEELRPAGVVEEGAETAGANAHLAQIVPAPHHSSTLDKLMGVVRTALPIAQKVLPLIDGQVATVVSNLLGPPVSSRQAAQSLRPLQEGLEQLEQQHLELRSRVAGQGEMLKQIDEQLEAVRTLAQETAEEQQNLAEATEKMRRKVNFVAIAGLVLVAVALALNVFLVVQVRRVLD